MKLKSYILLTISAIFLVGCGQNLSKPKAYSGTPLPVSITKDSTQMKGAGKKYLTATVTASINTTDTTKEQRASTVIDVAYKAYEKHKDASAIYAYLYDQDLLGDPVARVSLYPKKCGMLEDSCDGIQWDLYTASNTPTQLEREALKLWEQNKSNFQVNNMTDEAALIAFIAKKLNTTSDKIGYFSYNSYENHETF